MKAVRQLEPAPVDLESFRDRRIAGGEARERGLAAWIVEDDDGIGRGREARLDRVREEELQPLVDVRRRRRLEAGAPDRVDHRVEIGAVRIEREHLLEQARVAASIAARGAGDLAQERRHLVLKRRTVEAGPVPLEQRELGVVMAAALAVAERARDLEDGTAAGREQSLHRELGRGHQEERQTVRRGAGAADREWRRRRGGRR